jgi:hypothetical protein
MPVAPEGPPNGHMPAQRHDETSKAPGFSGSVFRWTPAPSARKGKLEALCSTRITTVEEFCGYVSSTAPPVSSEATTCPIRVRRQRRRPDRLDARALRAPAQAAVARAAASSSAAKRASPHRPPDRTGPNTRRVSENLDAASQGQRAVRSCAVLWFV